MKAKRSIEGIYYIVYRRKRRRTIGLSVDPNGNLIVIALYDDSLEDIDAIVLREKMVLCAPTKNTPTAHSKPAILSPYLGRRLTSQVLRCTPASYKTNDDP